MQPCQVGEKERKGWKTFEKVVWLSQNTIFKKLDSRCSIDRKTGSINRTRQRLTEFLKQDFDWSKIRLDQSKFWKNSFLEKITWFLKTYLKALNIRYKNAWVWDEMFFQNTSFKPNFSKNLDFKQSPPLFLSNKSLLHKLRVSFKLGWSDHKHTHWHVQCLTKSNLCCVCN